MVITTSWKYSPSAVSATVHAAVCLSRICAPDASFASQEFTSDSRPRKRAERLPEKILTLTMVTYRCNWGAQPRLCRDGRSQLCALAVGFAGGLVEARLDASLPNGE